MKLNDDYEPVVGDLVQYVGASEEVHIRPLGEDFTFKKNTMARGQIGVIAGRVESSKWRGLYTIRFPSGLWCLPPQYFKVIKKYEKNT
jgi:hypothetical protein